MRILYYNWVDYLDDEARGGGVSVYQRNLMRAWNKVRGVEASFLSAGLSHDLRGGAPRWEQISHGPQEDRDRRYEIVNSAVLAPAHHAFGSEAQISDPATEVAVEEFIHDTGPYDVIHFNNLEGLPVNVLRLKGAFPQSRFILSLHNYYPVCPQVNLWQDETRNCVDFDDGRACVGCLPHRHDTRHLRLANALAYRLKRRGIRPGTRLFDLMYRNTMRVAGRGARALGRLRRRRAISGPVRNEAAHFFARRTAMVSTINESCDAVLCVSDRVRQIAAHHGIRKDILHTSYIGTAHADHFAKTQPRTNVRNADGTLNVAYLGYMRADKGFPYLLDALEALPESLARRLHLTVAAMTGHPEMMRRMNALRGKLASLTHVDGYSPDGLDALLAEVGLGLIPVMWEDNLPQVAIEMHARHIPLLTSNLGGASELGGGALTHRAGDAADFAARIEDVLEGRIDWQAYWAGALAPLSMADHLEDLRRHYAP